MDLGPGLVSENQTFAYSRQINYYVDSVLGNDNNDGTHNNPLRTFQRAVDLADDSNNPGANNIYLKPGVYDPVDIEDDDQLKVFGQGHNPWDVRVFGGSENGNTIDIYDSSDVRLYNMHVTGSYDNGIYAEYVGYLFVKNVISNYHDGAGLYVYDVDRVKVYHSSFKYNENYGAHIENVNYFRSMHSQYDDNYGSGVAINDVNLAQLVASSARNNMYEFEEESRTIAPGAGVSAININELLVNGGQYNANDEEGIFAADIGSAAFHGVQAAYNGNDGINVESFDSAVVNGGHFVWNGDDGVELEGFQFDNARTIDSHEYDVQVFGGVYHNNYEDGLDLETVYSARVIGIDSRWNEERGLNVLNVDYLHTIGGYLYQNVYSGARFFDVGYAQVNDMVSKDNAGWGLRMQGGHRLNVIGGVFMYNNEYAIAADGFGGDQLEEEFDGLQRVDIKHATVLHNYGGVEVNNAYLAKMQGGTYSQNDSEGILMNNVLRGQFHHIIVHGNGDDGLRFNAGFLAGSNAQDRNSHTGDFDWFEVDIQGGFYYDNEYNGINITTFDDYQRFEGEYISLHVNADHVVSRHNGYTGLQIGGFFNDGPGEPLVYEGFAETELYFRANGGYFGNNGEDGIYLLGNGDEEVINILHAELTDVVAQFNGGYGVLASGYVPLFDGIPNGDPNGALTDHQGDGEIYRGIHFLRGFYGFNGYDGIKLNLVVLEDFIDDPVLSLTDTGNGHAGGFYSVASFDHVVANSNHRNGVNVNLLILEGFFDPGSPTLTGEPDGNNELEYGLVHFEHGAYNGNGNDGVSLTANVEFIEENLNELGGLLASVYNVTAVANQDEGLDIEVFEFGDFGFFPDVVIKQGVFNANKDDGIFLNNLDDVLIYKANVIGNHGDGIHALDVVDLDVVDSHVVGNRLRNIRRVFS